MPDQVAEEPMAELRRTCLAWQLLVHGQPVVTPSSILAEVRAAGVPGMLKIATVEEEAVGSRVMRWWDGRGAARVLRAGGDAVLLEWASGPRSLTALANSGDEGDDRATRILCRVSAELHGIPGPLGTDDTAPEGIRTLEDWFSDLLQCGTGRGGFYARAAAEARALLAAERESVLLHGDLHHGNVLDFGARGWLAIDPKGIAGDRAFDFANILCNPTLGIAMKPGRLERRVAVIEEATGISAARILRWTVAWCGLSALWSEAGCQPPDHTLAVGHAAELLLRHQAAGRQAARHLEAQNRKN